MLGDSIQTPALGGVAPASPGLPGTGSHALGNLDEPSTPLAPSPSEAGGWRASAPAPDSTVAWPPVLGDAHPAQSRDRPNAAEAAR